MKTCDTCANKGTPNGSSCTRKGAGYCVNFSKHTPKKKS